MPKPFDLKAVPLPQDSDAHRLLKRFPDIELIMFLDGDHLVEEGEESQESYLVLRGSYVVEQRKKSGGDGPGAPLAIQVVDESEPVFVGEIAYLGDSKRTATVRASGSVYTLRLSPEHMQAISEEFTELSHVMSKQIATRLKEADLIIATYREQLDMKTETRFLKEGELLYTEGTPANALFHLVDGRVVKTSSAGVEEIGVTKTAADFLNARPFFMGTPNDAKVHTKGNAIVVVIDSSSRTAAVRNFPDMLLALLNGDI